MRPAKERHTTRTRMVLVEVLRFAVVAIDFTPIDDWTAMKYSIMDWEGQENEALACGIHSIFTGEANFGWGVSLKVLAYRCIMHRYVSEV